jgi:phosphate/sulfate permease
MKEGRQVIRKIVWGYVPFGSLLLLMGVLMIFQGIEANKSGTIIPPTTKAGPLTGSQSILIGCLAAMAGVLLLGHEVFKKIRQKRR